MGKLVARGAMAAYVVWATYLAAYIRAWDFGVSFGAVLAPALFVLFMALPVAVAAVMLLRLRLGRALFLLGVLFLLPNVIGQSWIGYEEIRFRAEVRQSESQEVSRDRWWPFQSSYVGYSKQSGFYGGD